MTSTGRHVMSAPKAAELAGITYRQLGYWEQRGWVTATVVDEVSADRRVRGYGVADVVRLAALRHLNKSGFDVATVGPMIGDVELDTDSLLVVGGDPVEMDIVARREVVDVVSSEGRWCVFDPASTFALISKRATATHPVSAIASRRTA